MTINKNVLESYTFKMWLNECRINRIELYLHDYCEVNDHIIRMYAVKPKRDDSASITRFCVWVDNDMYIYDTFFSSHRAFQLFEIGYQRGERYDR